jgi:hypothetical protein
MNTHSPSTGAYSPDEVSELLQKIRDVLGDNESLSTRLFSDMQPKELRKLYVLAAFMTKQDDGDATVVESINGWLQVQAKDGRWNFFRALFADFASIIQSLAEQNPEMEDMLTAFDEKDMCLAVCNGTHAGRDNCDRVWIPPEIIALAMHHGLTQVLDLDIQQDKETANEHDRGWRSPSKDDYINTYKAYLTGASPLDELPTATADWLGANCRG